jgi:hypothetical protein
MIEKSLGKTLSHLEDERMDHQNILSERDLLDHNFIYSKEIFSNFINFNIEDIEKQAKSFEDNILPDKETILEEFDHKNESNVKNIDTTKKNEKTQWRQSTKLVKIRNLQIDEHIIEIEDGKILSERILDKQSFQKTNVRLFKTHCNKILLREELENFNSNFKDFAKRLISMELDNIKDIFDSEEAEKLLFDTKSKEISQSIDQNASIEKFRFEKDQSSLTAKKRKSIDSSSLLSNLSLQDVFNSTNKKLLDKNSNIFNTGIDNIIIEEDSNMNINTLSYNLRTNLNYDLEYVGLDDIKIQEEASLIVTNEKVSEEVLIVIEEFASTRKKTRRSGKAYILSIDEITQKVSKNIKKNYTSSIEPNNELKSIVFYQMLMQAQSGKYSLAQDKPFSEIKTL